MGKVVAGITTSLDGYITGPDDGPGQGLGVGGEALHAWVFGRRWTYEDGPRGEAAPEDKAWLEEMTARAGAIVVGRGMYDAAGAWGGANPWDVPMFVVTHHDDGAPGPGFTMVPSLEVALDRAREAAGDKDVSIGGGADVVRQVLAAGQLDELILIVAPLVLGGGKRLFEGFTRRVELEQIGVRQGPFATFLSYRVPRAD